MAGRWFISLGVVPACPLGPGTCASCTQATGNSLACQGRTHVSPLCLRSQCSLPQSARALFLLRFSHVAHRLCWLRGSARVTLRQAETLQATGEDLVAQQDGGRHGNNVVAACRRCNARRHKHRPFDAPDPASYRAQVQLRVKNKRWHPSSMFNAVNRHQPK